MIVLPGRAPVWYTYDGVETIVTRWAGMRWPESSDAAPRVCHERATSWYFAIRPSGARGSFASHADPSWRTAFISGAFVGGVFEGNGDCPESRDDRPNALVCRHVVEEFS